MKRGMPRSTLAYAVPFWVAARSLGCLADPPTFAPRGQIPPFIIAGQADPPLGSIYEGPRAFEINVPFRSEDVNTELEARLYLDLVPGTAQLIGLAFQRVPAGNYEELRLLSMPVPGELLPVRGCHSLTLIMTYEDNLDLPRGGLPIDEGRAARAVWWLNIGDTNGETRMAQCRGASRVDAVPGGG